MKPWNNQSQNLLAASETVAADKLTTDSHHFNLTQLREANISFTIETPSRVFNVTCRHYSAAHCSLMTHDENNDDENFHNQLFCSLRNKFYNRKSPIHTQLLSNSDGFLAKWIDGKLSVLHLCWKKTFNRTRIKGGLKFEAWSGPQVRIRGFLQRTAAKFDLLLRLSSRLQCQTLNTKSEWRRSWKTAFHFGSE